MSPLKNKLILALAISMSTSYAEARYACSLVFQSQTQQVQKLVNEDAYMQWLLWEQTANVKMFHKPTQAFQLPLTKVPKNEITLEVDKDAPQDFLRFVGDNGTEVVWFKHPFNKNPVVPYLSKAPTGSVEAYFTASRSIALGGAFRGLTIKLGTDHPHGPKGEKQPTKANTADDVKSALLHTAHLKRIDSILGKDSEFVMLPEVMTVSDKNSRTGYVIRDVREMDSGHYYLPALSIPYVGREIAQLNGQSFEVFWQKNYAELLGRAKARMLLRYGLQMETPNSQNMLIEMDRNLQPTGRIFFRDISDSFFVKAVAEGLGFDKEMKADIAATYDAKDFMKPYWSNSSWRFDEAGALAVKQNTLKQWGVHHNRAYHEHLEKELGIHLPAFTGKKDESYHLYKFFESQHGQKALKAYRAKHPLE